MSVAPRAAAVLAAIALLTALTSPVVGAVAALVLAGAVAADALSVRRAPEVVRRVRSHLARGVATPLRVETEAACGCASPRRAALAIEPREGDGRLEATLTPRRRGRHTLQAVALRSEGPLGLGRWRHEGAGEQEVTVYPDVPAARRLALAVRQGRFRAAGRLTRGPLGLGTEFESIRDYEPDDDIRQVNWRATERMQRPMSNQYRVEQDREVMLLIDAGRLMASPLGDRTRLDVAVDAAVAVALVADVLGDRAGTLAFDRQVRRQLAPRRGGGHGVIRALLDLEPRAEEPDYELAFRSVEGAKRSLMLIFCDLLEETAARPLVDAVPVLSRRHAVTVASVRDPDLDSVLATAAGRRPRGRGAGGGARRPRRPYARRAHAAAGRRAGGGGAGRAALGGLRGRLPAGQDAGARVTAHDHQRPVRAGGDQPDAGGHGQRRVARADEALDHAGQHQPRHRAEDDLHRRARLAPQRGAAGQRPGVDDRPPEPQPGHAADRDAAQLQQAVREDEAQQVADRPVLDRQPERSPR